MLPRRPLSSVHQPTSPGLGRSERTLPPGTGVGVPTSAAGAKADVGVWVGAAVGVCVGAGVGVNWVTGVGVTAGGSSQSRKKRNNMPNPAATRMAATRIAGQRTRAVLPLGGSACNGGMALGFAAAAW